MRRIITTKKLGFLASLTPRERLFIQAYWGLGGLDSAWNASKAIRIAGYMGKRSNQAAYKLRQRPRVKTAWAVAEALFEQEFSRIRG
jgi:hypothetical protein